MATILKIPDADAHEPGCLSQDSGIECAYPDLMYLDVFCECHRYTEPKVLSNGCDIAWPAGWTQKEADEWRAAQGLKPPLDSNFIGRS
jgi:hypothetical protein